MTASQITNFMCSFFKTRLYYLKEGKNKENVKKVTVVQSKLHSLISCKPYNSLELYFTLQSHCSHKLDFILLGYVVFYFYVINQNKVEHDFEVENR